MSHLQVLAAGRSGQGWEVCQARYRGYERGGSADRFSWRVNKFWRWQDLRVGRRSPGRRWQCVWWQRDIFALSPSLLLLGSGRWVGDCPWVSETLATFKSFLISWWFSSKRSNIVPYTVNTSRKRDKKLMNSQLNNPNKTGDMIFLMIPINVLHLECVLSHLICQFIAEFAPVWEFLVQLQCGYGEYSSRSELTDGLSTIVHLGPIYPLVQGDPEPSM